MASYTCPQCGNTLKRGSWELLTHCPDCNAEWSVDPTAPARNLRKIRVFASVYTVLCLLPFAAMYLPTPDGSTLSVLLCLIPLVGAVAGILGMFWGYLAIKFRQSALGMVAMLVSATAGMVGQGAYTWWMFGQWDDHRCLTNLTTLSASIREFEATRHQYPETIAALSEAKLPAPDSCLFGKYFYLPPWGWRPTEISATMPAAVHAGFPAPSTSPAMQPSTRPDAPATLPAAGATSMPASWATSLPVKWQPAFFAASMPVTELGPESASQRAWDPSQTLMVAELSPAHRYDRMCVMADGAVRALPFREFDRLLTQPQNVVFAQVLEGARRTTTQPALSKAATQAATQPASRPATRPSTSLAPTTATGPSRASAPSAP